MEVIFEDNHLLALNKPAGILTHTDNTGDKSIEDMGKEYLKKKYQKPGNVFLTPVHRLDRPVSGLILLARTSKALPRLTEAFKLRETKKKYYAVVAAKPKDYSGTLTDYLVKNHKTNVSRVVSKKDSGAKKAILKYEMVAQIDELFLLKVNPLTGRSHQIRVQLAKMGCPIVGDSKYGSKINWTKGSIALHSTQLSFSHPTKKEMVDLECKLPNNPAWHPFKSFL